MFNPFCLLTSPLLQAFVKAGNIYFVRQTFNRGSKRDQPSKRPFLFCHYSDMAPALAHYKNIAHDGYRRLYKWENEKDRADLLIASGQPEGFIIYANVLQPNWQDYINPPLRLKVKNYIDNVLVWTPGRNETVKFSVFPVFGEVYAHLKLRGKEAKVKLEDIENN